MVIVNSFLRNKRCLRLKKPAGVVQLHSWLGEVTRLGLKQAVDRSGLSQQNAFCGIYVVYQYDTQDTYH